MLIVRILGWIFLISFLTIGVAGWAFYFFNWADISAFLLVAGSEYLRNVSAVTQSVFVILGIVISVYLFVDGANKRNIDREHLRTSLLSVSSIGTLIPDGRNRSVAIELCFENVGTSTVKLWDIGLVDVKLLEPTADGPNKIDIIKAHVEKSIADMLTHWRLPNFGIRAKEKYFQLIYFAPEIPIGTFVVKFHIFFDHAGTTYDTCKPFDIVNQNPRKKERPWFNEASVLVKSVK